MPEKRFLISCIRARIAGLLPGAGPRGQARRPTGRPQPQRHPMTFFVTSVGLGKGGDLGGLAGADAHCQALATAVGAGNHTWHAYLSTQVAARTAGRQCARPHRHRALVQHFDAASSGQPQNANHFPGSRRTSRRHARPGAARQQSFQAVRENREGRSHPRRGRSAADRTRHPHRLADRRPRLIRIRPTTPATIGRAAARAPLRWAIPTASATTTRRGTPRMPPRAAARPRWRARAAPACFIALPSIEAAREVIPSQ